MKPDRTGVFMLVVVAVLFGLGGLLFLSEATSGVGLIAFGCLLAILGRIHQAGQHHTETKAARERLSPFERQQP